MRNAFADEVTHLAQVDSRVVLLSGDIGNRLFDRLRAAKPEQFLNCGIAEPNMMGGGMGMQGNMMMGGMGMQPQQAAAQQQQQAPQPKDPFGDLLKF